MVLYTKNGHLRKLFCWIGANPCVLSNKIFHLVSPLLILQQVSPEDGRVSQGSCKCHHALV